MSVRSHASPSPYVVRRLNLVTVLPLLALPVFVAFEAFSELPAPTWFAVPIGLLLLWNVWSGTERLRVDADGVRFNRTGRSPDGGRRVPRAAVPWTSIRAVIVFVPSIQGTVSVGETELGVRLEPGAPLPAGVRAIVYDPRRPGEVPEALRLPVRGWSLDQGRLAGAVRAYGGGVALVESRGGSERRLTDMR